MNCAQVLDEVSTPLRVVQIGLGKRGRRHLETMLACRAVELVGVSDVESGLLAGAAPDGTARTTEIPALLRLADPEAAVLALPHDEYRGALSVCLGAGLFVLKEKPLGRSVSEALEYEDLLAGEHRRLVVGVQRRQSEAFAVLAEALSASVVSTFAYRYVLGLTTGPTDDWRAQPIAAGGGAVMDMGYHALDLVVGLLGVPHTVYAVMHPPVADGRGTPQLEQRGTLVLEYAGGCTGTVFVGRYVVPESERYSFSTDDCTYEYDRLHGLVRQDGAEGGTPLCQVEDSGALLHKQLHQFVLAARGRPSRAVTGEDSMPTMVALGACYESARTGQPVST